MSETEVLTTNQHLPNTFGLWSGISVGWLTVNAFGGLSFILFDSIASSACVLCIMLVFSQCAARFSTAGGAYHYAAFLLPDQYKRSVSYPLGWLNYFGWILTHAACCSIVATCLLALINLCNPEFAVDTRWQLFLAYVAVAWICWLVNLFGLKGIPTLEILGCWITALGFAGFSVALLVKAPKASAEFVFVEVNNQTGYSSTAFAVVLGLMNSFATLMGLDSPTHLAEELPQPKRTLPQILIVVILSQFVVGVVWILVLGFSITDLDAILATSTGVPIVELIRLGTDSQAAAIVFTLILMINNGTSALGSAITMSRQGFAFARDEGLFWNDKLTAISPKTGLPVWSITFPSIVTLLIGLVFLFSNQAFNAIIGAQAICQIISFGFPAFIMLATKSSKLPAAKSWNYGILSTPIYVIVCVYAVLVTIIAFIPQSSPVTASNMNYAILIMGIFAMAMVGTWYLVGRHRFSPPLLSETFEESDVIQGVVDDSASKEGSLKKTAASSANPVVV
ncbi:unnamed protein product [Clonostachys rosea]|uniref:Amino acid permease/ SLC12A domain-containing protein n=1 Tax=Bionectria ochroleuca TaxID=29856 RepID=A0ABY6UNE6_BIOOC|nr:unnamed protein product [Clonostachys rosea]